MLVTCASLFYFFNEQNLMFWVQSTALYPAALAQSVICLTADPGVASSIPARSHTFMEIDHEIISTLFSSLSLIQEGLLSVTSEGMCTKYWLARPGKSVVW